MRIIASLLLFSATAYAGDPGNRTVVEPFSLPIMNGNGGEFNSEEHGGKVLLIENYFVGCGACNANAQNVNNLAIEYEDEENFLVLDVGIDRNDSQYETWINRHNPNHPVLKDANRELTSQLGTRLYPSAYLINCQGEVVYKHVGSWYREIIQELRDAINETMETCR